jgi:hypothetical protein
MFILSDIKKNVAEAHHMFGYDFLCDLTEFNLNGKIRKFGDDNFYRVLDKKDAVKIDAVKSAKP